jgi:phosphatidylinositol alpha-mannosyltransferase
MIAADLLPAVDRALRIGICAPYDLGLDGGVNSHIRAQARALRRLGHHVSVFGASSRPLDDGEVALSGAVSRVFAGTHTGLGIDPRAWRRAARFLEESRFDVVHMHEPLMPLVSWCVLLQATSPIVATFHTYRERGHRWYPRYRWLFAPMMRRVRARLAVSEAARRTVAPYFPGNYEILPNGVDVMRFAASKARPSAMPSGQRHVLFVGRLEPRKGVDRLIRAMTLVRRSVPDAGLVVVGDGPDRARLEALAHDTGVPVTFAGRVDNDALPGYYQAAHVVCSPALGDESFGIVLVEAMAAARPIVATAIDGYKELVGDAGCARLVEVNDVAGLGRELSHVLSEPSLAQDLGRRGASFVCCYDWNVVARRLEAIYTQVCSRRAEVHTAVV